MAEPLRVIPVLAAGLSLIPGLLIIKKGRGLANPAVAAFLVTMLAIAGVNAGGALMMSGYGAHLFALGQGLLAAALLVFAVTFGRVEKISAVIRWTPGLGLLFSALLFSALVSLPEGPVVIASGKFEPGPGGRLFQTAVALALIVSLVQIEGTLRAFSGSVRRELGAFALGMGAVGALYATLSIQLSVFGSAGRLSIAATSACAAVAATRIALALSSSGLSALEISVSRHGLGKSLTLLLVAICIPASFLVSRAADAGAGDYFTLAVAMAALSVSIVLYGQSRLKNAGWLAAFRMKRHDYKDRWLEATEKISSRTDPAGVKAVLSELVSSALGASNVNVWLYDQGQGCFFSTSSKLEQRFRRIAPSHRLVEHMLSMSAPFYLSDCETGDDDAGTEGAENLSLSTGAVVCAPLSAGRELIGFLTVGEEAGGRPYSSNDLDLLRAVAAQSAVQIKNLRLSQDLLEVKEADAFSRMSSFVMHDLKNFTNSLALLSHNARSNMASPEFQKEAVKAIDLTVARMRALIEKMAGGGGRLGIVKRQGDLRAVLERAVERLPSGAAARLTIESDGCCTICSMDPDAVETVFFNMLMNACDAIGAEGEISVSFQSGQDFVTVRISDTGSGIPKGLLEKGLFRPFTTTKNNGFGIGLHHCKAVMEAHGGRIEVESEEGVGTVFTLRFPLHSDERLASSAG
ncbi:MAG: GAF domain-containing protein [Deltaproteobacteria bacterium]|nr:GAF domain-containing protein [Deltaproteobacteria bacterium]MBZ0219170.1 GAF domain-containing protein [Deltaproteobacteria bacterium]